MCSSDLTLFLLVITTTFAQKVAPTITYGKLTNVDKVIKEPLHMFLTNGENPLENSTVDLCNDDAYLYLINIRPNKVSDAYSKRIKINGENIKVNINCRLAIYRQGTVVIPHGSNYKPLKIFTEKNFKGDSDSYGINTFHEDLGEMNRRTRSFHLKKGYMVTFATASDCSDSSRVFIADRSEVRRAGKECTCWCRFRWSP